MTTPNAVFVPEVRYPRRAVCDKNAYVVEQKSKGSDWRCADGTHVGMTWTDALAAAHLRSDHWRETFDHLPQHAPPSPAAGDEPDFTKYAGVGATLDALFAKKFSKPAAVEQGEREGAEEAKLTTRNFAEVIQRKLDKDPELAARVAESRRESEAEQVAYDTAHAPAPNGGKGEEEVAHATRLSTRIKELQAVSYSLARSEPDATAQQIVAATIADRFIGKAIRVLENALPGEQQ